MPHISRAHEWLQAERGPNGGRVVCARCRHEEYIADMGNAKRCLAHWVKSDSGWLPEYTAAIEIHPA